MNSSLIQDVLEFFIKRYNIKKPKILLNNSTNKTIKLALKDNNLKKYFINGELISGSIISIQKFGTIYKDVYELNDNMLYLIKRVYYDITKNIFFERIYPDELDYKITKKNGITYYYQETMDNIIKNINGYDFKELIYYFHNSYLDSYIKMEIPVKQYISEFALVSNIFNKENILTLKDLFDCIQKKFGNQFGNIFLYLKNKKELENNYDEHEIFEGIIKNKKVMLEEDTLEFLPEKYLDNNKLKVYRKEVL